MGMIGDLTWASRKIMKYLTCHMTRKKVRVRLSEHLYLACFGGFGETMVATRAELAVPARTDDAVFDDQSALLSSFRDLFGDGPAGTARGVEIVQELLQASVELRSVFAFYANRLDGQDTGEGTPEGDTGIPRASWVKFVDDVRLSKLAVAEEVFSASCIPAEPELARLDELQFLGALVRLAHRLSREGGELTNAVKLVLSLKKLLHECVLPFARRDNSTSFNKVMATRPELVDFLEESRSTFSGFGKPEDIVHARYVDCLPADDVRDVACRASHPSFVIVSAQPSHRSI